MKKGILFLVEFKKILFYTSARKMKKGGALPDKCKKIILWYLFGRD